MPWEYFSQPVFSCVRACPIGTFRLSLAEPRPLPVSPVLHAPPPGHTMGITMRTGLCDSYGAGD